MMYKFKFGESCSSIEFLDQHDALEIIVNEVKCVERNEDGSQAPKSEWNPEASIVIPAENIKFLIQTLMQIDQIHDAREDE